jgi:hypothetical protein
VCDTPESLVVIGRGQDGHFVWQGVASSWDLCFAS